ncbi:MAG: hypothetical protein Q9217_001699 [Psora testacea]
MSSKDDGDYRVVARYKLNDGRFLSLGRKGPPPGKDGKDASKLPRRKESAAPLPAASQQKRPSLQARKSSAVTFKSQVSSEASSSEPRQKPPKLPPRPPKEKLNKKRPATLSRSSSNAQSPGPRKPSVVSRTPSSAQIPVPQRLSMTGRTEANGLDPTSRRSSGLPRMMSQGHASGTKRPSLSTRTTSDARNSESRVPSGLHRSTSRAEKPGPKRPSLTPSKCSKSGPPRPQLSSTASDRKISFQDGESKPSPTPNGAPKAAEVSEDIADGPKSTLRTPSTSLDASGAGKSLNQMSSGDKEKTQPPEEQQSKDQPAPENPKLPRMPSKRKTPPAEPENPKIPKDLTEDTQDEMPTSKLSKDDRDLKSILTEDQCADLTLLIAELTKRMREDIESHFDASKGLKLFKDENGGDSFENLDYDPATVDVTAYDKERKIRDEQQKELAKPEMKRLKEANLKWFDEWRQVVILRVGEAVNSKEKASGQGEDAAPQTTKAKSQQVQKIDAGAVTNGNTGPKLVDLFPRVKTPLTKLPMGKRVLVLHSMLLLLLSLEHYNAASRVLLLYLTTSLKIGLSSLKGDEEKTAQGLLKAVKEMSADKEASKRLEESHSSSRKWKIRLASAVGAAVIGYTGGLAAPMIAAGVGSVMGELGLGATAAAGYLGSVAGNAAVVGSLFGAYGGRMTGQVMSNISAGVQDFAFLPIHGERKEHDDSVNAVTNTRRLRVIIAVSGWLIEKEEVVTPWRVLKPSAEVFALRFELEALLNLGQSFDTMLQSAVYGYAQSAMVKRTVFAELMGGMMWPMALTKVARVVDNPFSVAQTRADKAGQVLADALINHVQGERPVTLVGYSLGARVVWSCLTSLAKQKAFGLVESAVLMGAPIASDTSSWRSMRAAVSGRLVNVYSENDYLLAFLYRTSSLQYGVAGLVPIIGLAGVENVDVTETVSGHLRYRYLVGSILQKIRFEDVNNDEVAKEAKAFEAIVEEEKKRTYLQQAGDLYENYKGKKPQPKTKGRKQMDISDADAEKQASAMEKSVDEKTKKSLMQWAVEQLYLSRPSTDKAKGKAAELNAQDGSNGKSYYQWAKEATYLSRSGSTEGKEAAKDKQEQAQEQNSSSKSGYLASAAGYIPTGYVPGLRSSGKAKANGKEGAKRSQSHPDDSAAEASGYSSYLPSFGKGGSSSKSKENTDGNPDASDEKVPEKAQGAQTSPSLHEEDTGQSVTTDTECGGGTDEDPFTSPPEKGGNKFADAAKAAEGRMPQGR